MEEGYNDQSNGVTTISWTLQNIWVFKISDVPLEDQVGFPSGWSVSVSLAIPLLKKIVIDSPKNIQMHSGALKTRILHILLLLKQRIEFVATEFSSCWAAKIWTHGLCVGAVWLYQLSYEDPFIIP